MLEEGQHGQTLFRWTALAGEFAPYLGGTTPRHLSPCGLCLDRDTAILVSRPARVFEYFNDASAPIIEDWSCRFIMPMGGWSARSGSSHTMRSGSSMPTTLGFWSRSLASSPWPPGWPVMLLTQSSG